MESLTNLTKDAGRLILVGTLATYLAGCSATYLTNPNLTQKEAQSQLSTCKSETTNRSGNILKPFSRLYTRKKKGNDSGKSDAWEKYVRDVLGCLNGETPGWRIDPTK